MNNKLNEVNIVIMNINSNYEDDVDYKVKTNDELDSPKRILDLFIVNTIMQSLNKDEEDKSKINYTFSYMLNHKYKIECSITIIENLSFVHNIILEADGQIIFFNLDDPNIVTKLSKITSYIKDSCCYDVISYFIGIYNDVKLSTYRNIEAYLNSKNILYEFYMVSNSEDNSDSYSENINIKSILNGIIGKVYSKKNSELNLNFDSFFNKEIAKDEDKSMSAKNNNNCHIY